MVQIRIQALNPGKAPAGDFSLKGIRLPFRKEMTPGLEPSRISCRSRGQDAARPTPMHRAYPFRRPGGQP